PMKLARSVNSGVSRKPAVASPVLNVVRGPAPVALWKPGADVPSVRAPKNHRGVSVWAASRNHSYAVAVSTAVSRPSRMTSPLIFVYRIAYSPSIESWVRFRPRFETGTNSSPVTYSPRPIDAPSRKPGVGVMPAPSTPNGAERGLGFSPISKSLVGAELTSATRVSHLRPENVAWAPSG